MGEKSAQVEGAELDGGSAYSRTAEAAEKPELAEITNSSAPSSSSAASAIRFCVVRTMSDSWHRAGADSLAWELGLRGYDAVHLASALLWKEGMGQEVALATFDQQLWEAASQLGLVPFPDDLPGTLASWQR
jgi:predicted nucleic acid-binding protein